MGRVFVVSLEGKICSCKFCGTHLALNDDLVSQPSQCRHGAAYLFNRVVNVTVGEKEERQMMTGAHTIVDIFCAVCGSIVGWKYEIAHEKSQKYKEGKFVLEQYKISGPDGSNYLVSHKHHATGVEYEADCGDVPSLNHTAGEGSSSQMSRMESLEARMTSLEMLVHRLRGDYQTMNANAPQ